MKSKNTRNVTPVSERFSRREVVRLFGKSAAFMPLLAAAGTVGAAESKGRGGVPQASRKLMIMAWPNGVLHDHFWPKPILKTPGAATEPGAPDFVISEADDAPLGPLTKHAKDLLVVGGTELSNFLALKKGGGHAAFPALLTGDTPVPCRCQISDGLNVSAASATIDQFLALELAKKTPTPVKSLVLQSCFLSPDDRFLSFRGAPINGKPNAPTPETDVYRLFDSLFAGATSGGEKLWYHRRSVLDHVARDLASFARDLGQEDRNALDRHLGSVRDIEQRLGKPVKHAPGCKAPTLPIERKDFTGFQSEHLPEGMRLQADLTVAAMRCGITNIATLNWGDSNNCGYVFYWLGKEFTEGRDPDNAGFGGKYRHHHRDLAQRSSRRHLRASEELGRSLVHVAIRVRARSFGGNARR